MTVHRSDDSTMETDAFTAAGGTSGTENVAFSRKYTTASPIVGPAGGATLLGTLQAKWSAWIRDAGGQITGMQVLYDNGDATAHDVAWSVAGLPA